MIIIKEGFCGQYNCNADFYLIETGLCYNDGYYNDDSCGCDYSCGCDD